MPFSPRLCWKEKQPRIFGEGDQERDFIYVADVVDANIRAMTTGDASAYNIGTGQSTNVNRIFEALRDIIKYKWDAEHRAARPGEVFKISLECQKACDELGWAPQVSLEEGLERTTEFFRKAAKTTKATA